jgi:D-amino peptidase
MQETFMKIYISADIEGIGCIVRGEQSSPQGREYQWARKMMTEEVNAAARGAFEGGASTVVVSDSHNVGLNLIPEELDERVSLVMGSPRPLSMMEGIQMGFDGVFLVGYHSMAGAPYSTIAHVFNRRIGEVRINDVVLGEIGISAALAGHYNAPVVMVTGDDRTLSEAKALLGSIETVETKKGVSSYAALCPSPIKIRKLIFDGANRAVNHCAALRPFWIEPPLRLQVRFTTSSSLDRVIQMPGVERLDGLTVSYQAKDVLEAFSVFHLMTDLTELVHFI